VEEGMKVLLINGSPNKKGCTYTALTEVTKKLNEAQIDTEIVQVGHKNLRGCMACRQCKTNGKCAIDDIVNEVAPKFEACDGIVIGSPVYFASANGTLVSFIDRLFYSVPWDKTMKVGAAVVSSRRGGASATFDQINKYFAISGMPIASSQYWNSVHGYTPEDVYADKEGCQTMRTLGSNMAFLIKSIHLGKEKFGLPEKEERIGTNFIR
jgi:multimeric flavodoxin WrbA